MIRPAARLTALPSSAPAKAGSTRGREVPVMRVLLALACVLALAISASAECA